MTVIVMSQTMLRLLLPLNEEEYLLGEASHNDRTDAGGGRSARNEAKRTSETERRLATARRA